MTDAELLPLPQAEMSFSAKPQPLTLISCTPHSRSIRRDFVGCAHTLRPLAGGLRSLRNRRNLAGTGRHSPPSRFLIRASLGSHSILVLVAVVTFSAVSVLYLNRSFKRKRIKLREVRGQIPVEDRTIDFDALKDEIREARNASGEEEAPVLQFHNSAVISGSNSVQESLSPLVFESTAVLQPLHFPTEVTDFEKIDESLDHDPLFELPNLMGDSNFGVASASVTVSDEEITETSESASVSGNEEESVEVGKMGEANGFRLLNGESVREEIHMFYEANKSEMKLDDSKFSSFLANNTLTNPGSFPQVSHHSSTGNASRSYRILTSLLIKFSIYDIKLVTLLQYIEHCFPLFCSEYVEGKTPNSKEGHVRSREDLGNGNGYVADKELRHLPKKNHKIVPQPNGIHTSETHNLAEQLSAYHRLLKDGRYMLSFSSIL